MKNTGRYLEAITASIEKSLVDNPNTLIVRNKKLLDRDGVYREVDIYVETVVNKKKLKYAIECKEYKGSSRVELRHVSDFHDKIANQGIKGIIITTSDFRQNAIKKANNLNIDIYKIIENPNPIIKKLKVFNQRYKILKAQLHSSHFEKIKKPKYIYMGSDKKRYTYKRFMEDYLKTQAEKTIQQNRAELFDEFIDVTEKEIKYKINLKKPRTLFGFFELVYFKQNNVYYPIEKWQVNCSFWIDYIEEENPTSFTYFDVTNNEKIANFFAKAIEITSGIKGYMNLIELAEDNKIKVDYITDNPKEQKNIIHHDFGTFKEGDLQINEELEDE